MTYTGNTMTAIDLFSGAGGMALGLERAGFDVVYAADKWKAAIETYNLNFDHEARELAITWDTKLPDADIFAGGPPCQGFSSAGPRTSGDARNTLVAVFAHLVTRNRPRAFVFENVEGFLTGDRGRWVVDLLRPVIRAGYAVALRKVNAANYGVPQHRKRVLVVGGLGWFPDFPGPTHQAYGAPGAELVAANAPRSPTVMEALEGLGPAIGNGDSDPSGLDHCYRVPNDADEKRFRALGPGQTMRDLPPELWHETYKRRAFRRVMDGTPSERRGGAPAGVRRLDPFQPSKAITSGAVSEFVHPSENRALTIRECARLQTFPDNFRFAGNKSEKALLIGNAVPPILAQVVFQHISDRLRDCDRFVADPGLYEFTPTFSKGMSPALERTSTLVHSELRRYIRSDEPSQLSLFGGI